MYIIIKIFKKLLLINEKDYANLPETNKVSPFFRNHLTEGLKQIRNTEYKYLVAKDGSSP